MNKAQKMHIPKHYFHDRTVLVLQAANTILTLYIVLYVLLTLNPATRSTFIVQHRSNLGNSASAFTSGPVNGIRIFTIFALVQYFFGILLSIRLYFHRRHLAITVLSLTLLLLILCTVVSNVLILSNK